MRNAVLNNINKKDAQSICIRTIIPAVGDHLAQGLEARQKMLTEDGLYTSYKDLYRCP